MANTDSVFSATLQALRKKNGVTQEQLANHLGVSPQAVSKWENGSYPEGDLLPKISEFFGVSISYLYGQEKEAVSLEHTVFNAFAELRDKAANEGNRNCHNDYFEQMLNLAWAFQTAPWPNNKDYYNRGIPERGNRTASVVTDNAGYSYFNLNKEKEYFMLVKEPEEGFKDLLSEKERMREFFSLLGKKGALEILECMLTLNWGQCLTTSTIASHIGMSVEETEQLLEEAGKFQHQGNNPFNSVDIINGNKSEKGFLTDSSAVCSYISLFLITHTLLNSPFGYQMQIGMRDKSWIDKKSLEKESSNKNKDKPKKGLPDK